MGRTRLRGLEVAGIRIAVESPPAFCWSWPDPGLADLECAPIDPDIYVGVSIGTPRAPDWEPVTYSCGRCTFDIGRVGEEWAIAIHGPHRRFERMARFDARFREGELIVSPGAVGDCAHPLVRPLLDIVMVHRLIALGGVVVAGTAVLRGGRGLAFLGSESVAESASVQGMERGGDAGATPFCTSGGRFALRLHGDTVRAHGLPGEAGQLRPGSSARLDAIHIVSKNDRMVARSLSEESATSELLQRAYAPVHDPDCASQLMRTVARISSLVPSLALGLPRESRVVPFEWGTPEAALAFAAPSAS